MIRLQTGSSPCKGLFATLMVCVFAVAPGTLQAQFQLDIEKVADSAFPNEKEDYEPASQPVPNQFGGRVNIQANIEQWIFGQHRTEAKAKKYFENQLQLAIRSIERNCKLTAAQIEKLELAGAGDIAGVLFEVNKIRGEFSEIQGNQADMNRVMQRIGPLQRKIQSNLFARKSIFRKVSARLLDQEQQSQIDKAEKERLQFHFLAALKSTIAKAERAAPLRASQREQILQLASEMEGPLVNDPRYMGFFAMYQLSTIEPKLKTILNKRQYAAMENHLRQGRQFKAMLTQQGLIE